MTKIRNCPGSGDCKIGGYAGPVDGNGRSSGTRKSPDAFSGASPPAGSAGFSVNTCPQKHKSISAVSFILAVFLCFSLFFTYEIEIGSVFNNFQTIGNVTERPVQAPAAEPVKAKEPWFGTLGDGKFQWRDIVSAMALPFAVFTSCKTEDAANQAPTANAGSAATIKLPTTTYTLNGSGTDPEDGTNVTYAWTIAGKPNGAANPTFSDAAKANPTVSGLNTVGDYTFQLIVTDTAGQASAPATVKIEVLQADPITVTKNIEANLTFTPGTTMNFTPTGYTPIASEDSDWQDHFSAAGITYTLTDNLGNSWNSAEGFNGMVSVGDGPYANSTTYTFTQTFKLNDTTTIGSHTIRVRVFLNNFASLRDVNDVALDPQVINPVPLTLSKQVQP